MELLLQLQANRRSRLNLIHYALNNIWKWDRVGLLEAGSRRDDWRVSNNTCMADLAGGLNRELAIRILL